MEEIKDFRDILQGLVEKLHFKMPKVFVMAIEEFEGDFGIDFENHQQFFTCWFFCEFVFVDSKTIPQLMSQFLDLNGKEKEILHKISNVIQGYFEVIRVEGDEVYLKDLLTDIAYKVDCSDINIKLQKKDLIFAKLVKNFNEKLFFFGTIGFRTKNKEEIYNEIEEFKK